MGAVFPFDISQERLRVPAGTGSREQPADPVNVAMNRYADGDEASFEAVYDALAPRLYRFLFRRMRHTAHAEDLVQQTFLLMHHARGTFVRGADVVPWAFAIAHRLVIDRQRRARYEVTAEHDARDDDARECSDPRPDEALEGKETEALVARVLVRLSETHRAAFELCRLDGLSVAQAAEALGTTTAAVKLRVHRTYEALRSALEKEGAARPRGVSP